MDTSEKIKIRRKHLKLSQVEAASRCGWDQSRWSKFERKIRSPNITSLKKISSALEINPGELI